MVPDSFARLVWGFGEIGDGFGNAKVEEGRDVRAVGGSMSLVGRLMKCGNSDMFAFRMFVFQQAAHDASRPMEMSPRRSKEEHAFLYSKRLLL